MLSTMPSCVRENVYSALVLVIRIQVQMEISHPSDWTTPSQIPCLLLNCRQSLGCQQVPNQRLSTSFRGLLPVNRVCNICFAKHNPLLHLGLELTSYGLPHFNPCVICPCPPCSNLTCCRLLPANDTSSLPWYSKDSLILPQSYNVSFF